MWKNYLSGDQKNSRSSGLSVRIAAFISALFLSLLCSMLYNMWKYENERIALEEGSGRTAASGGAFPVLVLAMGMASVSLIVIIHNAFAVTMSGKIRQLGTLSSIGTAPKQIRACLLQEAISWCAVPVLIGNLSGILCSMGLLRLINVLADGVPDRQEVVFGYHPLVLALTLFTTGVTVWISAWLPAKKMSKVTPLEAIKNTAELQLKRRGHSPVLVLLFGVEGELAGNAMRAQRKALRMASLSLSLAFLAFTVMLCMVTISQLSTGATYFERYQDVWDIMVTVKGESVDAFGETEKIRELSGVENAIAYQKAVAKRIVTEEEMSEEMRSFGGFSHAGETYVTKMGEGFLVNAPIIILDDASFLAYCEQIGITPRLDGAVILNRIRDVTNPDFRHPEYMPYIKGKSDTTVLRQAEREESMAEIPVLGCTESVPALREEYATIDYYELVHFLPASLWRESKGQIGGCEEDLSVCILSGEDPTAEKLSALQGEIDRLLGSRYTVVSENRIQEKEINDRQIRGMMAIFSGFCVLLAIIGIGNVFSNTLGFVHQRKREFARYLSVGMTPGGIRKLFCIEALVLVGRPFMISLPIALLATWAMLRASYLPMGDFLTEAPFIPVIVFEIAVLGAVALAYYLGWRQVKRIDLPEVLRDDSML